MSLSVVPPGLWAAEADGVARPCREAAALEVGDALPAALGEAEATGLIAGLAFTPGEAAAGAPGEA
jgi:hypothetical protein